MAALGNGAVGDDPAEGPADGPDEDAVFGDGSVLAPSGAVGDASGASHAACHGEELAPSAAGAPSSAAAAASSSDVAGPTGRGPPSDGPMSRASMDIHSGLRFYASNGGHVSLYSHMGGAKVYVECTCPNREKHGRCTLTRVIPAEYSSNVANRGRLLGYVVAWLNAGIREDMPTKGAHFSYKPSLEERLAARAEIAASPVGRTLAAAERPRAPGEPEEHPDLFSR